MFKKSKLALPLRQPTRLTPIRQSSFSYHAQRQPGESSETGRHNIAQRGAKQLAGSQKHWWHHLPAIVFIVVAAIFVGDALILQPDPKIIVLNNTAAQVFLRSNSMYEQAAERLLAQSLANRNKLTVNTVGISKALEQKFPELSEVSIALPLLGHRPIIYIAADTPALLLSEPGAGSFVLGSSGKAIIAASSVPKLSNLKLPLVTDQSGLSVRLGKAALSAGNVDFIETVVRQLQAQHFAPNSLTLPTGAGELDVGLTGQPYFVKFNLEGQAKAEIGTFSATAGYLAAHHITPQQYIDVRVAGRAYYK